MDREGRAAAGGRFCLDGPHPFPPGNPPHPTHLKTFTFLSSAPKRLLGWGSLEEAPFTQVAESLPILPVPRPAPFNLR